jgi:hypothetical protein
MINANEIHPDMPVVCSQGDQFATVDHMEGSDFIKLKKDNSGQHHYIPMSWVTSTDQGQVHVDRPGQDAMNDWLSTTTIH